MGERREGEGEQVGGRVSSKLLCKIASVKDRQEKRAQVCIILYELKLAQKKRLPQIWQGSCTTACETLLS